MGFTVDIRGSRETARYLKTVSTNLDQGTIEIGESIAAEIVTRARQLVPVDTGMLRETIEVIKTGRNFNIVAGAGLPRGYGIAQERGFKPHYVPVNLITNTTKSFPPFGSVFVSKFTPFMRPALSEVLGRLDIKVANDIKKLLRRR